MTASNLTTLSTALTDVTVQSLETMAFLCCEPGQPDAPEPADPVVVTMGFAGPVAGTVQLVAPRVFGQKLASGAMGVPPEDEEAIAKSIDAIKELLNVIVGALMPHICEDEHATIDLTLPFVEQFTQQLWNGVREAGCLIDAEGDTIALRILPPAE